MLLIGLDGATWTLLDPLISAGKLPGLSQLVNTGARGVLKSTIPPVTASAWSSLYTGRSPGRHGVFDFRRRMGPETTKRSWITSTGIGGMKFWEIAAAQGKTAGLVNLPLTFPPSPVNGYVIAGMPVPPARDDIGLPKGLIDEVIRETGEYVSDVDLLRGESPDVNDPEMCFKFVDQTEHALKVRGRALEYLMSVHPTDLTACVFVTPDRLSHLFWKVLVPEPSDPPLQKWEQELQGRMIEALRAMDSMVGEIIGRMSPDDLVVVISDHGFGPLNEILKLNRLLGNIGYLSFKPEVEGGLRRRVGRVLPESVKAPLRAVFGWGKNRMEGDRKEFDPYSLLDWPNTRAYSGGSVEQGVFLNVNGREPYGTVEMGAEYHRVREDLLSELRKAKHPEDGTSLFDWVEPREKVYSGEQLELAPDIMFSLRGYRAVVGEDAEPPTMGPWSQPRAGFHRREGIYIMNGPMIQARATLEESRIEDIAPTILACWGLAADTGMDGKPIEDAVKPEFLEANPQKKQNFGGPDVDKGAGVCDEDADEMEDLLKGLGYLN